ncbi:MAG: CIA30 family protein [Armatimonadetes bacterium]|nr:CIA30 family protein [Anaerolineae bacterium]
MIVLLRVAVVVVLLQVGGCGDMSWIRFLFPQTSQPIAMSDATLFDFSTANTVAAWFPVNDGVMGGVSQSTLTATNDGTALFSGDISFKNNGGFATTQSNFGAPLDLSVYQGLAIRVRGDGKRYGIYLRDGNRNLLHQATFETVAGEWQDIQVPFASFEPTYFGQPARNANPLNPGRISAISFIIEYKQEGAFALELARVGVY